MVTMSMSLVPPALVYSTLAVPIETIRSGGRVVNSATSLLEMRGNLLVSVLSRGGGGSTTLNTFSLTDPANPMFLGTTGDIPYGSAVDLVITDTHAFVVLVNFVFTLGRDIIDQNGGVIAVNISNPAAPFFDGDAINAAGPRQVAMA